MICQWVFEVCKKVAKLELVVSGYRQYSYIEWENYYQKLHLRLPDTILNRTVPTETILELNEMLLDVEETTMDVVIEVHEEVNTEDDEETDDECENCSGEGDIVVE